MTKRKVLTVVGTRPEIIKMSRVLALLDRETEHVLVHTGQNYDYELNEIFFDQLEIRKPDHFLEAAGATAAETIAKVIDRVDRILEAEAPEALMLYGDTNSCLAVIAAKRRKIPVFHMEAGNRCFDQRVPEEINRKIVDHLSDINMVLTEQARDYLLAEGLPAPRIIKTGSHMPEVLDYYRPKIDASTVLDQLSLRPREYFIVSSHREENVDVEVKLEQLIATLEHLHKTYKVPVVVSTHPRTRKRLEGSRAAQGIQFLPPFGFPDYIKLQENALCVLSDSGTLTEEAALLGLRGVMIRDAHERPEGMDAGTLVMSTLDADKVADAVRVVLSLEEQNLSADPIADYQAGSVSRKVLATVLSYIDYVNRVVWSKP
jgi:UDP-N-acetylglucosamine 2-epimerase